MTDNLQKAIDQFDHIALLDIGAARQLNAQIAADALREVQQCRQMHGPEDYQHNVKRSDLDKKLAELLGDNDG
jgi:hypothetical protein